MNKTVAVIVAAFNRKELLIKCIDALLSQSRAVDCIYIIDNASTDGTTEMLTKLGYLDKLAIEYIKLPVNIGASGGIHEGMKRAYDDGHDFLWVMDDDAEPSKGALESLCDSVESKLKGVKEYCLYSSHVERTMSKFTEPVTLTSNGLKYSTTDFGSIAGTGLHEGNGGPFLGFFLPRLAVERVGLPNKDTFIWGDSEYFVRLRESGFRIFYDTNSILFHPQHSFASFRLPLGLLKMSRPIWRSFSIPRGVPFKQYYGLRNSIIIINKQKGFLASLFFGILRGFFIVIISIEKFEALKSVLWAIWDGVRGKMHMRFLP